MHLNEISTGVLFPVVWSDPDCECKTRINSQLCLVESLARADFMNRVARQHPKHITIKRVTFPSRSIIVSNY
jgi:hypothetical protein